MLVFVGIIIVLYLLSWRERKSSLTFLSREKSFALRGILAMSIMLHHLSLSGVTWLGFFRSWGAPVVSLFFFLSGYGLTKSYISKGDSYLNGFFRHRLIDSVFLPFLLVWILYRLINWERMPGLWEELQDTITEGNVILPNSWFVLTIMIFYTFFYISFRYMRSRLHPAVLTILCICYIVGCYIMGYDRCWYISAMAFPFGIWIGMYEHRLYSLWDSNKIYYCTVPLCLIFMALCFYTHNELAYLIVYMLIPLTFLCLFSRVHVEKICSWPWASWLSKHAYEIYLTQGMVIEILRSERLYITSDVAYVGFCICLTLGMAALIRWSSSKIVAIGL